jgi:ribosomal protein S18 acetylase RimI-like enzyme
MRNNNLSIRNARLDELDQAAVLIRDSYKQYENSINPAVWKSYVENMMDVRGRLGIAELILAEMEGRLVGTVTLYPKGSNSSTEGWPPSWAGIRLLGVHPAYRGRGIGRALMEECIRRCREMDVSTIGLHTTGLMDLARRMYEKMGFVRAPEFDHHPAPGVVVMAYRLDL